MGGLVYVGVDRELPPIVGCPSVAAHKFLRGFQKKATTTSSIQTITNIVSI